MVKIHLVIVGKLLRIDPIVHLPARSAFIVGVVGVVHVTETTAGAAIEVR